MDIDIRSIEAFLAVADELHFGRAAERLHMSQSPLSQTIKRLERHVGTRLFERTTRAVSLTSAGQALLPHAQRMVRELDLALRATRAGPNDVYGQVRLGFSGALNHVTLPCLIRAVRARHPRISIELVDRVTSEDAVELMERDALDIAFVGLPVPGSFSTRVITIEPLSAALPSDHPLADRELISLVELVDDEWVLLPEQSALRTAVITACHTGGFRPQIAHEVKDAYVTLSLVAAGLGVSLMPRVVSTILPPGAVLVGLTDPPQLRSALLWHPGRVSDAVGAVLSVAADVLPTPG